MPEPKPDENIEGQSMEFHRAKWSFAMLVGDLCDDCLSVGRPAYETILLYDRRIRAFKASLPGWLAYDPSCEHAPGTVPNSDSDMWRQLYQRHHITVMINETLLFLHRVAFANAIEHYPAEPLRSPWSQSVVSLCLEACRTLIAVAKSASELYPKLAARWWHLQVHAFGAGVCLAAVCIKAPGSALIRVAWHELNVAMGLLESLGKEAGHAKDLHPRLKRLRDQAQSKLEAYQNSPSASLSPHSQAGMDSSGAGSLGQGSQGGAGPLRDGEHDADKSVNVKEEDGEQLAVLGAATRKLEGNFVQRHQVSIRLCVPASAKCIHGVLQTAGTKKDTASHNKQQQQQQQWQQDRDREQTSYSSSSGKQSAGRSRETTHMLLDAVAGPTVAALASVRSSLAGSSQRSSPTNVAFASRTIEFTNVPAQQNANVFQQHGGAFPQANAAADINQQAMSILPNPSTYIQRYDELDAGLADVLNSISESPDLPSGAPGFAAAEGDQEVAGASADSSYTVPPVPTYPTRIGPNVAIGQSSLSKASALSMSQRSQIQGTQADASSQLRQLYPSPPQSAIYNQSGYHPPPQLGPVAQPSQISTLESGVAYEAGQSQAAPPGSNSGYQAGSYRYASVGRSAAVHQPQPQPGQNIQPARAPADAASQFGSPGHEYFERHPSVSAPSASYEAGSQSALAYTAPLQQASAIRPMQPPVNIDATAYSEAGPSHAMHSAAPADAIAAAGNGYLDSAWMDYFPTPGVGLFQQAQPPHTPDVLYAAPPTVGGPAQRQNAAFASTNSQPTYFQQPQHAFPARVGQGRYYGIEQQMRQPQHDAPRVPSGQQPQSHLQQQQPAQAQQQYRSPYAR